MRARGCTFVVAMCLVAVSTPTNSAVAAPPPRGGAWKGDGSSVDKGPLPEPAQPAIWEGRAARRRSAPSTDRGWASKEAKRPRISKCTSSLLFLRLHMPRGI